MAKFVMTTGFVSVNGVDLSAYAHQITLEINADAQETTTFGSGGWREYEGGLKGAGSNITFRQDYAAGAVDATLNAIVGTKVPIKVRQTSAAVGTTNPEWQFNAVITNYGPIGGGVGDVADTGLTLQPSGAVVRATA